MCALESLLSWITCVQRKNPFVQDWSLCLDTQKTISYLDHFCARKVGVFASIQNLDLKMKIIKVFHCAYDQEHSHMDVLCVRTQICLIIICLPMLDYLRKYIYIWMYSAYVRRYS